VAVIRRQILRQPIRPRRPPPYERRRRKILVVHPAGFIVGTPLVSTTQVNGTPNAAAIAGFLASTTRVTRRIEIYNSDGTMWKSDAGIISGSVSISNSRKERRTFELVLNNQDRSLDNYPGGFWYDKVIKLYRGAVGDYFSYEAQLGEFVIDGIDSPHFPFQTHVTGRDRTKTLQLAKFANLTTVAAGQSPETLIRTIATNAGITKFSLPTSTGKTVPKDLSYERDIERWEAVSQIADSFGYDLFFDPQGYLTMLPYPDPTYGGTTWTFQTGPAVGNMASYSKSSSDSQVFNSITVAGAASDIAIPVSVTVTNTQPDSPTSIAKLGTRSWSFTSPLIGTVADATQTANSFLKIKALESFNLDFDSIVFPWLDVNQIIKFIDPKPITGQPDRYLLTDLTVPLSLGPMSGTGKRITIVG
jgi:hypothetical protein